MATLHPKYDGVGPPPSGKGPHAVVLHAGNRPGPAPRLKRMQWSAPCMRHSVAGSGLCLAAEDAPEHRDIRTDQVATHAYKQVCEGQSSQGCVKAAAILYDFTIRNLNLVE